MRKLYLANGNEQFKFADTTTEISLTAFDDGGLASLTANAKARIKSDSGYLLEVSASVTNNRAVITSGQLAQLPAGNYLIELWDTTANGGTAIYPSDGFLALRINENATGLSGGIVSSITVDDFIQQFSDLSQQLKEEASAVGWSSEVAEKINNAIKGVGFVISSTNAVVAPYDSLDTLPLNSVVTYAIGIKGNVRNAPAEMKSSGGTGGTVMTYTAKDSSGAVQILVTSYCELFYRVCWGYPASWGAWFRLDNDLDDDYAIAKPYFVYSSELEGDSVYADLNNLTKNQVVTYAIADMSKIKNAPSNRVGTLITYSAGKAGQVQVFVTSYNESYQRILWAGEWSAWSRLDNDLGDDYTIAKPHFVTPNELESKSSYSDLNNLASNQVVTYAVNDMSKIKNAPSDRVGTLIVYSAGKDAGQVQTFITTHNETYQRIRWGSSPTWGAWQNTDAYKPAPSLAMFQKIGIVGDSYASGELAFDGNYQDHYEISWGQILARKSGATAVNFSCGGLTTRSWLTSEYGLTKLNSSDAQDLYILALGINDRYKLGESYIGSESDIDSVTDTFYGNYGKIIKAVQSKAPNAKIVISTLASSDDLSQKFNSAIEVISKHFGIALIKQSDDPFFTSTYYLNHMYGGHPTGPVYAEMANAIERLISQQMVDNISYFETYKK